MTIAYGPCVLNSGVPFWLPLPIEKWSVQAKTRSESTSIPGVAGRTLLFSDRDGFTISIEGRILGYALDGVAYAITTARTAENAQNIRKVMEGKTQDGATSYSPFDGTFSLWRWKDRSYLSCYLESMSFSEGRIGSSIISYSLDIVSTGAYLDTSDSISADNDWQAFIGHAEGIK